MNIAIDCRTILNPERGEAAGIGHYTYFLVENLVSLYEKDKFILFFDRTVKNVSHFKRTNTKVKRLPFIQYKKYLPFIYSHLLMAGFIKRQFPDVFHSPACTLPLAYTKSSVVTVHDLAIFHQPEWFPKGQRFSIDVVVPRSLKQAKKIIAVSKHTKEDLVKFLNIPPEKIKVIYEGVDTKGDISEDIKKKFKIKDKYILYLGTIEPRKNISGIIEAFADLKNKNWFGDFQLVIAGKKGWLADEVFDKVKELGLEDKVIFTGYVSSEDKRGLFTGASLFVYPSFYEGFGLPILEAMYFATPVITSNLTSLPEIAGGAAILINPRRVKEIALAMDKVLSDLALQKKMIEQGYKQAKKFSWEKCAQETHRVYEEIMAEELEKTFDIKN